MSATIHSISDARRRRPTALSMPARELWMLLQAGYLDAHQLMLEQSADALQDWAERGELARECERLMRMLRTTPTAAELRSDFADALQYAPLQGDARPGAGNTDLQDGERIELAVAAHSVAARLEDRLGRLLPDVRRRLRLASQRLGVEMPDVLLDPGLGVDALLASLGRLRADVSERLVMLRLYERQLLARFPSMIVAVSLRLDDFGVARLPAAAEDHWPAAGAAPATSPAGRAAALVQQLSLADPAIATAWLSDDLQAVLETLFTQWPDAPPPQLASVDHVGSRAAMAGELVHAYLHDPAAGYEVREAVAGITRTILRVALCDPAFLSDPGHPLRQTLDRMTVIERRVGDPVARAGLLATLVADAARMGEAAITEAPVSAMSSTLPIAVFRQQLRDGVRLRQRWIGEAARARAHGEIQARLATGHGDAVVSPEAREFFATGLEPVLAGLLRRIGDGGESWRLMMRVLDQLLATLTTTGEADDADLRALSRSLVAVMRTAGFSRLRRQRLLGAWSALRGTGAVADALAPTAAPVPAELPGILALFRVGVWFNVQDAAATRPRYGQVASIDMQTGAVTFSSITGRHHFTRSAAQLLAGVRGGRVFPLAPDPQFQSARERLIPAQG